MKKSLTGGSVMKLKKIIIPAAVLAAVLTAFSLQSSPEHKVLFEKAKFAMETKGDLNEAIKLFNELIQKYPGEREYAAKSQLYIGLCYEKLGLKEAQNAFQKVVDNYPEQAEAVRVAREKLEILSKAQAMIEKGEKEFRIRQVWADAIDSYFSGAPSPDGRYLTYVNWQDGNLGVRDLEKGENRLLTKDASYNTGEMASMSIFSPDGRQVAYTWQNKEGQVELRIIGMDGSAPRVLYASKEAWPFPASWSGDGKQILTFFSSQGHTKIAFVSTEDGSVKDVKSLPPCPAMRLRMSLSPDGKYIAYSFPQQQDSRNSDIFLLAADGSRQVPLIEHPADDLVLGWSPDGKGVVFKSDRTGSIGIWTIRVADGKSKEDAELVRADMGNLRPLGITRDGSLYYGIYSGWNDIYVASIDPETGQVLTPPFKAIQKYEGFNSAPSWSPDGQELVCRSSRGEVAGGGVVLLIRSFRTGEIRELVPKHVGGLNFHYIRWSPDGRSFLGIGPDEKGKWWFLFAINAQTGDAEAIAHADASKGEALFSPEWAPEGKVVYFMRSSKGFRRLIRYELETDLEKELFRFPQSPGLHFMVLSPDGRQLAFNDGSAVKLVSTSGGEPRELIQAKDIRTIAWASDGQYILYGKTREGTEEMVDLWRVPVKGGEPQKLDLAMAQLLHLRAHPDGRRVAFTAKTQNEKSEVWVMENFLPKEK
jgi:Tol biopolymer transport system component